MDEPDHSQEQLEVSFLETSIRVFRGKGMIQFRKKQRFIVAE
jgi:hypothetical protein